MYESAADAALSNRSIGAGERYRPPVSENLKILLMEGKMRKRIAILLTASLFAGSLSGCGAGAKTQASSAASAVTEAAAAETASSEASATETAAAETSASGASVSEASATEDSAAAQTEDKQAPVFAEKDFPLYLGSPESDMTMPLFFEEGNTDIPYIDVEYMAELIQMIENVSSDPDYTLTTSDSNGVMTLTRDNGSKAEIDSVNQEVRYDDFNEFCRQTYSESSLDLLASSGYDSEGRPAYFSREGKTIFTRKGSPIDVELKNHDIPLYYQDEEYFMPLQTASDLFCTELQFNLIYNGQGVFMAAGVMSDDVKDLYYSAPAGKRSTELAEYNYNELALALDMYYGLKDAHNIDTFENYFATTGLDKKLLSEDPQIADRAIEDLCNYYLGDGHSIFDEPSFYAGKGEDGEWERTADKVSSGLYDEFAARDLYSTARAKAYPDGIPSYEEIGNTAYVTFDDFSMMQEPTDYYTTPATSDSADTIGIIQYAHARITRKGSPIKNVVLDLSVNGGGVADAAVYTTGWFLGMSTFNIEDTVSRMQATSQYRVDVNGDRVFDDKDSLADKKLFCIISPFSFSCGNYVPSAFKKSGMVTLLGRTSGGGACVVQHLSTADGTLFSVSGNRRISTNVNGSFYDVDTGVDPDFAITTPEKFYDRKALTEYINSLY
jgi:hypothetical protein